MAPVSLLIGSPNFNRRTIFFLSQSSGRVNQFSFTSISLRVPYNLSWRRRIFNVKCFATDKRSSSEEISISAKIRSEVLSPFRSVRMFFYLAFVASASLGGFIAMTQLLSAFANSSRANSVPDILNGLAIDLGAVSLFSFLYYRENNAKNNQLARLSREETLANLKLRVDEKRIISISDLRGVSRLVIVAGPASFILESFQRSIPFIDSLLERGVLVVPFTSDGDRPVFMSEEGDNDMNLSVKAKRLWQLSPSYVSEWTKWVEEQKSMANVSPESPVYISLRMDGRVRGSGVGYPPWNAFVVQLPPVKGMWSGLLDGMDGRVL